jgi:hypothetical protein
MPASGQALLPAAGKEGMSTVFPPAWDPTSTVKKKRKTFIEDTDGKAALALPLAVPFQSDLQQTILRKLNVPCPLSNGPSPDVNLDHILSRVPYKTMLENLFSNVDETVPDVPILGRAYEESFMRQAMAGERQCVMGDMCECMHIDKNAPFVGVELRLQGDPDQQQMCVLCSRSTTQKCFYDMCFLGRPIKGVIQRYGGIFGQPGEYASECMLVCPRTMSLASMPVPAMSHQRNRYSVVCHNGIKHLRQHRVGWEDFQIPSGKEPV